MHEHQKLIWDKKMEVTASAEQIMPVVRIKPTILLKFSGN